MSSDCPPEDALPTNGIVYRLTEKESITDGDFLSYREIYPHKHWDGVPECVACGVSIYTDIAGIERLIKRVPGKKKRKPKKIIMGSLKPQHGRMKNTPSQTHHSHHTWWIPLDQKPWEIFQFIDLMENS